MLACWLLLLLLVRIKDEANVCAQVFAQPMLVMKPILERMFGEKVSACMRDGDIYALDVGVHETRSYEAYVTVT